MKITPRIVRPFTALFGRRVQITAFCEKSRREVVEPHIGCGECHVLPFNFEIKE
jgi:hypothetical protein